jgi:hypothetical protein
MPDDRPHCRSYDSVSSPTRLFDQRGAGLTLVSRYLEFNIEPQNVADGELRKSL